MKEILSLFLVFSICFSAQAKKFYLDPENGSLSNIGTQDSPWGSLEEVINANYIVSKQYSPLPYSPLTTGTIPKNVSGFVNAGDTLLLMNGLHGEVSLSNYINDEMIFIIGMEEHHPIIEKVHLQACKNWRFENVKVSTEPYNYYLNDKLFFIESHAHQGPSSDIVIDHSEIYSSDSPWTTTADWNNKMSDGLYIYCDAVTATNNKLRNVNFGLTAYGDNIIADNNQIINFAGDGMRMIGSHISFKYNLIKNCYKVNDNHDDGIQSWAQINGVVADDNEVIGNIIINSDDPDQPFVGEMQGIGCFDGFYHRWKVMNNLILVNHWHGITFLGAKDCEIVNNTVLDLSPDATPGPSWIMVDEHKDGTPSTGCVVANNVANSFDVDGEMTNNIVLQNLEEYNQHFVQPSAFDFHLLPTSSLIDAGSASHAPEIDIEQTTRPQGAEPDIGAYEYRATDDDDGDDDDNTDDGGDDNEDGDNDDTDDNNDGDDDGDESDTNENEQIEFIVYPNPFLNDLIINGKLQNHKIQLWNEVGQLVYESTITTTVNSTTLAFSNLASGFYILTIKDERERKIKTYKLIKY